MNNGLYNPQNEHDACGVGMVVNIRGNKNHEIVDNALTILENMRHRGAEGADGKSGDGAGIMVQIPHEFILLQGIPVPEKGSYGTGLVFLPKDPEKQEYFLDIIKEEIEGMNCVLTHIREVPVNSDCLGEAAKAVEPDVRQIFVTYRDFMEDEDLEICLYRIRKHIEKRIPDSRDCYICSLSNKSIVYKGMLTSQQLKEYYPDLSSPWFTSGLALVHSRFSTNTFPDWSLAQPFRLLAHNGEINTINGNRSWLTAQESVMNTGKLGDISDITPLLQKDMSDSASLDNAVEFFMMSGMSLPQAMSVLVPESFNRKNPISSDVKAFYEYYSILMSPWDGPAALFFSDGRYAGGMLDRNGLRPARYAITKKNTMIVASEVGAINIDPAQIAEKGRLEPGKILMVDTHEGRIYYDGEIKERMATEYPYRQWLNTNRIELDSLKNGRKAKHSVADIERKKIMFGHSKEDIEKTIKPMCESSSEPISAMGWDQPLAVISETPQSFFNYFKQRFSQVTNPAIDPIRESLVMSLTAFIGKVGPGILNPDEKNCRMIKLRQPIITNTQLEVLCSLGYKGFSSQKVSTTFTGNLEYALESLCHRCEKCVDEGVNYIILSDRGVDETHTAIPALLALSAVHHHLIATGKRVQTALIVESGEVRDTMHVALLLGYGASGVNPYMVFGIIDELVSAGAIQMNYESAQNGYIEAINKGLKKIMAKMGISTIRSYRGCKTFETIGLSDSLLSRYFGTSAGSPVGGIGLDRIAADAVKLHDMAYADEAPAAPKAIHAWNPKIIKLLQNAVRTGDYNAYKEFTAAVDNKEEHIFLRDFLDFKKKPISIDEVEPVEDIIKHFIVGAMSFGALSKEAHETIALAMNAIGGKSNTGEGGEDSSRYHETVDGVSLSSKVKQVASGRFGVTAEYLVNAEEIQIKVAQGAKPGEGGQLPGFKVDEVVAKTRHSIPGVTLISPPPHHDIYSIEDLAQLIFDLRNVNPHAKISLKLVASQGVGTIVAGVAKAKADVVVISGGDGGTGAAPTSCVKYAGISPEIGLADAQQTLMRNNLRGSVRLQVDGQLKTGHDVVMMALLGAEEFAFGTLPMIAMGCLMCRRCNTNKCATGICTQDPELRKRFAGKPEHLKNYFTFLATEVREYLAQMGLRSLQEAVGRSDLIVKRPCDAGSKGASLDFSKLLYQEETTGSRCYDGSVSHEIGEVLDQEIIRAAHPSVEWKVETNLDYDIHNTDRTVGTMLSGVIAARYGAEGLPASTVNVRFRGSAGQSFAAFLCNGMDFRLEGETNDYFCKGLCGGVVSIVPMARSTFKAEENMIAGNTGLYGATSGELYVNGRVGQRFAVRNSGAKAVIEGAGDHCCEYMTGGRVVVLGQVGRNFAAGMSGGVAYVLDRKHDFDFWCNMDLVELSLVENREDVKELHDMIRAHAQHTGSKLAREILDNWDASLKDFIKVIPSEYRALVESAKK
ncbi:MAG: glutamate synthase large subunit [Bacteroidales bacterium]|nr:glutamate synthase large subunit [Bacteroidales bacterium]